jgi:hypothetical protein
MQQMQQMQQMQRVQPMQRGILILQRSIDDQKTLVLTS